MKLLMVVRETSLDSCRFITSVSTLFPNFEPIYIFVTSALKKVDLSHTKNIQVRLNEGLLYLHLIKALNKVPHRLLWKLEYIGRLKGTVKHWMEGYLKEKKLEQK